MGLEPGSSQQSIVKTLTPIPCFNPLNPLEKAGCGTHSCANQSKSVSAGTPSAAKHLGSHQLAGVHEAQARPHCSEKKNPTINSVLIHRMMRKYASMDQECHVSLY